MNLAPSLIIELLALGCISGFLAGLLGIGGGMLLVPALIAATSVVFAPFGARAAHKLDVRQLKRAFACLLFALAAYMASRGLAG